MLSAVLELNTVNWSFSFGFGSILQVKKFTPFFYERLQSKSIKKPCYLRLLWLETAIFFLFGFGLTRVFKKNEWRMKFIAT